MGDYWQPIVTLIAVAIAMVYVAYRFLGPLFTQGAKRCGGCRGCDTQTAPETPHVVPLDNLTHRPR